MMADLATEAGRAFLTQGLLGAAVIILSGVIVFLYREVKRANAERIEDMEKIIEARENLSRSLDANTATLAANNRAMQERTRATEEMSREIERLRRDIEASTKQTEGRDGPMRETLSSVLAKLDSLLQRRD